jgi:hypothetical protein
MSCYFDTTLWIFGKREEELQVLQEEELPSFRKMKLEFPSKWEDPWYRQLAGKITTRLPNCVVIEASGNYGNFLDGMKLSQLYPEFVIYEFDCWETGDYSSRVIKNQESIELSHGNEIENQELSESFSREEAATIKATASYAEAVEFFEQAKLRRAEMKANRAIRVPIDVTDFSESLD